MENKKYLKIDIITYDGKYIRYSSPAICDSLVTIDNSQAWSKYLSEKITELFTPDVMLTPEFKAAEEQQRKEREREERYELQLIKEGIDRRRRSVMTRPKITYIPKGLHVDYEKEYAQFFDQEVNYNPIDSEDFLYQFRLMNRWQAKSVPQIMAMGRPDAAYAIAIELLRHVPTLINRNDLQEYIKTYKARIRKMIVEGYAALISAVTAWNNEEKRQYVNTFIEEQSLQYSDFRGLQKTLLLMKLPSPFTGDPIAVTREMSDEEALQAKQEARRRAIEERQRIEAEQEAKSLIPLNADYEQRIFSSQNVGWECNQIWYLMLDENKRIERLVEDGHYQEAALRFMQLTKSMCRHFILDEHYNYFDDMYSPEYAINDLIDLFKRHSQMHRLPEETKEYLRKAWQEIMETESHQEYGLLSKDLDL